MFVCSCRCWANTTGISGCSVGAHAALNALQNSTHRQASHQRLCVPELPCGTRLHVPYVVVLMQGSDTHDCKALHVVPAWAHMILCSCRLLVGRDPSNLGSRGCLCFKEASASPLNDLKVMLGSITVSLAGWCRGVSCASSAEAELQSLCLLQVFKGQPPLLDMCRQPGHCVAVLQTGCLP